MNVLDRRRTIFSSPVVAFAAGALVADFAVVVIPRGFGSSLLTAATSAVSLWVNAANLITTFSGVVVIVVGLAFVRRGKTLIASGVFVGLFIVLGLRLLASILTLGLAWDEIAIASIGEWAWQTIAVLVLQATECALLLLAARAAGRGQPAST